MVQCYVIIKGGCSQSLRFLTEGGEGGQKSEKMPYVIYERPLIIKWGDYSTFNTPTVVLKDIKQLWECQCTLITQFCDNGCPNMKMEITAAVK